jgi:RNA polymerase sigma factor (sigma-70 family)
VAQNSPELLELISRCRQGEDQAWESLFEQFQGSVDRWLARLNYRLNEDDIADLRQDVFINVVEGIDNYRENIPFTSWLFMLTERRATDDLRKRTSLKRDQSKNTSMEQLDPSIDDCIAQSASPGPSPDVVAQNQDDGVLLFACLEQLERTDRRGSELIKLRYFGDFQHDEIALQLGMNPATVRSALSKCMDKLRDIAAGVFSGNKS